MSAKKEIDMELALSLYYEGESFKSMAKKLGTSYSSLYERLNKHITDNNLEKRKRLTRAQGYPLLKNKRKPFDIDTAVAMYFQNETIESIAKALNANWKRTANRIYEYLHENNLPKRNTAMATASLLPDREIITTLYLDGLSAEKLAEKWEVSAHTMRCQLHRWGLHRERKRNTPTISLNDLKTDWIEVTETTIVTVGRQPKFVLTPLAR